MKTKFYINYQDNCKSLIEGWKGDHNQETSLVRRKNNTWFFYILNGDHREQYNKILDKGFRACYAYFKKNKHLVSSWSH